MRLFNVNVININTNALTFTHTKTDRKEALAKRHYCLMLLFSLENGQWLVSFEI